MKKYLVVESSGSNANATIQEWGNSCQELSLPCIIIFLKGNLAEIACDNWLKIEDSVLSAERRQGLEPVLKQLLIKYAPFEIDLYISEGRIEDRTLPTHLWYTFIHVPIEHAQDVAVSAFNILQEANILQAARPISTRPGSVLNRNF